MFDINHALYSTIWQVCWLYLDSTCSTVTGQNGTWFRLGSLVKGKNYLLEPSIRKWSIVGNPSQSNVWEMGKELPAMNNYTWHIFFRVLRTTVQAGQDTILKYSRWQVSWQVLQVFLFFSLPRILKKLYRKCETFFCSGNYEQIRCRSRVWQGGRGQLLRTKVADVVKQSCVTRASYL